MGSVRTIKYLVVDNVVDEVPDAAPEIDVEAATPEDIAAALLHTTRLPPSADIYLQTARPDGSLRWQPLNALSALPEGGLLLAKLVKPKGGAATGAPRPHPTGGQPGAHAQQQQQQQHSHGLIGKLLKKVVGGGSGGTTHTTHYSNGPTGPMMMGTAGGLGAAGAGAAGWRRVGGGPTDAEDAAWEQQVAEDAALAQLEEEAMRRDSDDDQGEAPQDDQAFENFEAAAGDYADQYEADNEQQQEEFADGGGDDNDGGQDGGGNNIDGGQDDNDFGGGDDGGGDDFGGGDDDFGGGDDE